MKKSLTTIGEAKDVGLAESKDEKLQEMITYVQFANDEADFGKRAKDYCGISYRQITNAGSLLQIRISSKVFVRPK